jgi:uncharacterized protein YggE
MESSNSKDILYKTLSVFVSVITLVIVYFVFFGPLSDYRNSLVTSRTMSVSVSDKVTAIPDVAQLSFSVVSEGKDVSQITAQNNSKVREAIGMLESNQISKDDIKTLEYNLVPVYSQPQPHLEQQGKIFIPQIIGYSLTQTILVKIRDFSKISSILEALPSLGINKIGGISFSIDNPETYYAQARAKAFKKAFEKAVSIAKENGVKIGKVINISDYSQGNYPIYKSFEATSPSMGGGDALDISKPEIRPGSQDITVNVTVVYEIK